MIRPILLLGSVALLSSCTVFGGLSKDERDRLASFQQYASLYWESNSFDQSIDMANRGLEIEADNYRLLQTKAWCLYELRDRAPDNLRRAEELFQQAWEQRAPLDHRPALLLGFGKTKQTLAYRHKLEAEILDREADNPELQVTERTTRRNRAKEHWRKAEGYWDEAERILSTLLKREELLRLTHKSLMEIAVERNDYAGAVQHGALCLERNRVEQEEWQALIRETMVADAEIKARNMLTELVDQEVRVRMALAEMHYRQRDFEASVAQLDELLRLDPTRSADYYHRGRALEEMNRREEARRDYLKFLGTTALPTSDDRVIHAFEFTQSI